MFLINGADGWGLFVWAEQDSNLRPLLCKRSALTN